MLSIHLNTKNYVKVMRYAEARPLRGRYLNAKVSFRKAEANVIIANTVMAIFCFYEIFREVVWKKIHYLIWYSVLSKKQLD